MLVIEDRFDRDGAIVRAVVEYVRRVATVEGGRLLTAAADIAFSPASYPTLST